MQRAARQETTALATKTRRAPRDFNEGRNAEADHLLSWIERKPVAHRRQLLAMPEGVDRLVGALLDLKSELVKSAVVWIYVHRQKIEAYLGRRECDVPHLREIVLSKAINGDSDELDPSDGAGLPTLERQNWAADRLIEYIDAEVARLGEHRGTLDVDPIALDRAEAGGRAMFDAGKEATLARKYEAAASRALYRALRELREVEATGVGEVTEPPAAEATALAAGDAVVNAREPEDSGDKAGDDNDLNWELGSFGTDLDAEPAEPEFDDEPAPTTPDRRPVGGGNGRQPAAADPQRVANRSPKPPPATGAAAARESVRRWRGRSGSRAGPETRWGWVWGGASGCRPWRTRPGGGGSPGRRRPTTLP